MTRVDMYGGNDETEACYGRVDANDIVRMLTLDGAKRLGDPEILRLVEVDQADRAKRRRAARDASTPPEELATLAVDFPCEVLENARFDAVLRATPDILAKLPVEALRASLAGGGSEDLLVACARHPDADVRAAVAANRRIPSDVAERLATDVSASVREAVAGNPALPPARLQVLVRAGSDPNLATHGKPDPPLDASELRAPGTRAKVDEAGPAATAPAAEEGGMLAWLRRAIK